jgi:uncharacterized protein YoxC
MPALIQICIVIVTVGLLAIVMMTLRMMTRFNKATEEVSQLTRSVRESVAKFDLFTHEAQALVASLRGCVAPILRVVERFEAVGQRTADLSSALLEELEIPVFTAAAVARGVRSGANHFLKRMVNRLIHRHTPIHGGNDHE